MPSQQNQKKFKTYFYPFLGVYVFGLYYVCHFSQISSDINLLERIDLVWTHILEHPFTIFPVDFKTILLYTYFSAIALLLVYVEYSRRKRLRTSGEHGTAAWNTDMKTYNKTYSAPKGEPHADRSGGDPNDWEKRNKNIILSNDVFLSVNGRDTMRNLNVLVTGGSGSGKSRFVVKPNLLQANCSFVVTDPSGELLESMGGFLKGRGYKIKVFNLVQMEHSCSYNPFQYIRNEEGVLTMINALIANTTPKGASKGDPFWEKAETALLQAICFYLYYECNMEDRNFTNVMKLLRCLEVREGQEDYDSTLDIMFKTLKERNPEHIAVRQYAVFKQAAGKTAQSIMVSCSVRLTVFNMESITKLTCMDNIDLGSMGNEKTALFCITPVVDPTFNFLVALLYTQLFETLYFRAETECKGKRLPIHVRFLLDEFANIGTIPDFEQKLATMRKYEISCTIIIQNLAQLKTMYKDSWESITGNCDTFIFLGGQEQTTLKYVSEKLGKETIVTQTDSRNFGGKGGGSSRSKQIIGRELMSATEISEMNTSDCIVFIRGLKPFFGKKYDYPKHPNYHLTGDADDKYLFDVKAEFHTGEIAKKKGDEFNAAKKRIKIIADHSETRLENKLEKQQKQVKMHPRTVSAKGSTLYKEAKAEEAVAQMCVKNLSGDLSEPVIVEENMAYVSANGVSSDYAFEEFGGMENEQDDFSGN